MNGKYLLDTNIVIALFADEAIVKNNLAQASEVFLPSIVIGELCYGAKKSGRVEANLARADELVANSTILGCGIAVGRWQKYWLHEYRWQSVKAVNTVPQAQFHKL